MPRTSSLSFALLLLALACAPDPNGPARVAERFWSAIEANELATAQALTRDGSLAAVREFVAAHPFEQVELGEVLDNEHAAQVPVHMVRAPGSGPAFRFHTHLVHGDSGWQVDLRATRRDLTRELLASSFEGVREALQESGAAFVEEFEERALEASEALRETLEGLEETLNEPEPSQAPSL